MLDKALSILQRWQSRYPLRSIVLFVFLGLMIGVLGPFKILTRSNIPLLKEGFMIVFPTAALFDPLNNLKLRGQKVHFVRHNDESDSCKIGHTALGFSANEKIAILSGNFQDIENFVLNVSEDDLKKPDFSSANNKLMRFCLKKTRVIYGEDL
jgi:uncharacterized membrane protein